jgi:nicotinic acid mononucleotide adenylyltransferase
MKLQFINSKTPGVNIPKLLILDSSFNPPTLAHKAFINRTKGPHVMLISQNNVDKNVNNIDQRLELMKSISNGSMIAVTDQARFVDKAKVIRQEFPQTELCFLMGSDTVERFFDLKYYDNVKEISQFFSDGFRIAYSRRLGDYKPPSEYEDFLEMVDLDGMDLISSTIARTLLKEYWRADETGDAAARDNLLLKLKKVLPQAVLDIILVRRWYQ